MTSKRKFVIRRASESQDGGDLQSGSLFKKYKPSSTAISRTASFNKPTSVEKENNVEKNTDEKNREMSAVETKDSTVSTASPSVGAPSSSNISSVCATTKPQPKFKVGRTFAETFSFLKDPNLYKLPPEKSEAASKPTTTRNTNAIIVNPRQRGNPILKHVRNVPWEFGEIIPDYEIGKSNCALFLSLRYHNLNPDYIHERLKQLGNRYTLRVLLVQVDLVNTKHSLKELARICLLADMTLILAWSPEEAGRYLETYKSYEFKPPDVLKEKVEPDFISKMQDVLTTIKSVNKTDVITLLSTFGSFRNIVMATKEEMGLCPGIGPQKAQRLHKVFTEPFKRSTSEIIKVRKDIESRNSPMKKLDEIEKNESESSTCKFDSAKESNLMKPAELLKKLVPNDNEKEATQEVEEVKPKKKTKMKPNVNEVAVSESSFANTSTVNISPRKPHKFNPAGLSKTAAISQSALSRTRKNKANTEPSSTSSEHIKGAPVSKHSPVKLSSPSNTKQKKYDKKTTKISSVSDVSGGDLLNTEIQSTSSHIDLTSPSKQASLSVTKTLMKKEISSKQEQNDVKNISTNKDRIMERQTKSNQQRTFTKETHSNLKRSVAEETSSKLYTSALEISSKQKRTTEISQEEYDDIIASDTDEEDDDFV